MIELAHEALTRQWPRLRHWLTESREARLRHETQRTQRERLELQQRDPEVLSTHEVDYVLRSGLRARWRMAALWTLAVLAAAAAPAVLKLVT
ncbi:hypothetical protein AB0O67_29300 [Streptomyces sp. NPDC086077]|uniref:nSTAND1 domain-containing NTPase n=1 Tax=Streptomyces sp. NPDC086077 TaxID=3154862 RepID=UPI00342E73EE